MSATKTITAKGGPLHGKRYDVHITTTRLDVVLPGGHYTVQGTTARWVQHTKADS
ncbi:MULTISPECIES: hypothetical protein [unclassified Microbacterium]|uniref:hypothetical protein n=1 Tax=Microbacterium TaxID=33882 RepID=UPI003BA26D2D